MLFCFSALISFWLKLLFGVYVQGFGGSGGESRIWGGSGHLELLRGLGLTSRELGDEPS